MGDAWAALVPAFSVSVKSGRATTGEMPCLPCLFLGEWKEEEGRKEEDLLKRRYRPEEVRGNMREM